MKYITSIVSEIPKKDQDIYRFTRSREKRTRKLRWHKRINGEDNKVLVRIVK